MKDIFHPVCTGKIRRLCTCDAISRFRTRDAIFRLRTCVMRSSDCQLNLGILRIHNAISRLCKFLDCVERMYLPEVVTMYHLSCLCRLPLQCPGDLQQQHRKHKRYFPPVHVHVVVTQYIIHQHLTKSSSSLFSPHAQISLVVVHSLLFQFLVDVQLLQKSRKRCVCVYWHCLSSPTFILVYLPSSPVSKLFLVEEKVWKYWEVNVIYSCYV